MVRQVLARYERSGILLDVQGAPTRNGKMKYDFLIQTTNPSTGQPEVVEAVSFLAHHAAFAALKGQQVTATIEQSQNGQYTNTDLQDIVAGGSIGTGVPLSAPVSVPTALPAVPPGVTLAPVRDYDAEALGKTRHGQFIAALGHVSALISSGVLDPEDDVAVLTKAIQFAEAGVHYSLTGGNISQQQLAVDALPAVVGVPVVPVPIVPVPIVPVAVTPEGGAASLPAGTVPGGTSGLPWGVQA